MYFNRFLFFVLSIFFYISPIIIPQNDKFICTTDLKTINTNQGYLRGTTWTLKVLLVEFQDIKHKNPISYTFSNFSNLFFSTGVYVSPNMYSPDGGAVFGSMNDYLSIMSDGDFTITGYVVNADNNHDNIPDWLTLPNNKSYYNSHSGFDAAAIAAANSAGLDISTDSTTKLAIIYAGMTYRSTDVSYSYLNPHASGNYYIMGERFAAGGPYQEERSEAKFSEIGINVHEFLHLVGLPDLYANGDWDIMNGGPVLGPTLRGECPAPLNPQSRFLRGWIDFDLISSNQTFQADYNLQDPEVFRINNTTNTGNYWLIENRRFNATMTIGSTVTSDYNRYITAHISNPPSKGVLVWEVHSSSGNASILHADGMAWPDWPPTSGGTLFPGTGNVKVLSPWSDERTFPDWVPNTKPSTNVGMEIVGEGTNYYSIDLYVSNPEEASPSKPRSISISWQDNHPHISWATNNQDEPDFSHYNIYKKRDSGSYSFLTTTTNTYFVDNSEIQYSGNPNTKIYVYYKITAEDLDNKESVYSDEVRGAVNENQQQNKIVAEKKDHIDCYISSNFPNPFNPSTLIRYSIKEPGLVSLKVFDILGKEIAVLVNEFRHRGIYESQFNASDLPSGVYIYSLKVNDFYSNQKMLLLK